MMTCPGDLVPPSSVKLSTSRPGCPWSVKGSSLYGEQLPVLSHVAAGHATAHRENVQLANVDANAVAPAWVTVRKSHDAPSSHSGARS